MRAQTNERVDILLVDDREDGLITLEALLGDRENYNLIKAQSGREAIGLLGQYDFAVILMDVQMPDLDGFETAEIIRGQPYASSIQILFVTAINKDDRYLYRGYEAGAVDYIFKPFDPMILRSKVAVFVDLHLKSRKLREQQESLVERDALEHRANVQALELESLRRYRNLADAIPHIVVRASLKGGLEYANRLWSKFTGLTIDESVGTGWHQAIHPSDLQLFGKILQHSRSLGEPFEVECRIRRFDGLFRWHGVRVDTELDVNGRFMAWLGTATEIHDRKASEEALRDAQKRAEAANDAKTHFLANMSHEIRTPLNAIMGFTELILESAIPIEEKMRGVSIVRRNGQQLLKIVDEILDISKVEVGGLVTEHIETSMPLLIQDVHAQMQVLAARKKIDLVFNLDGQMPKMVLTDSTRLRQILTNIIGNAIKFTDQGSVTVTARFLTKVDRSFLYFEVIDTGVGIDPEKVEKIFQPFSQADSSTTRLYGGTGLGLSLARRLARALGGEVQLIRSVPGQGSFFVLEVEVGLPDLSEGVSQSNVGDEPGENRRCSKGSGPLEGKRILLVEDAEDNQFLITQFLRRTGAVVDIASNGQEGIRKALENAYEVVLMDIQMPLIDGYQATSRLRAAGYKQPIIALTAHALMEEREKCLRAGCNSHLTKPIKRQDLINSLIDYI